MFDLLSQAKRNVSKGFGRVVVVLAWIEATEFHIISVLI